MSKPKVYLASKYEQGPVWNRTRQFLDDFTVISSWLDGPNVGKADADSWERQETNWRHNRAQVLKADLLMAYGESSDKLNGTMIEIGMAYSRAIPIYLIGSYPWGTWRAAPFVHTFMTINGAIDRAKKDFNL